MAKHTLALSALLKLHRRLADDIRDNRDRAKRLAADMKAVEVVIRMLEPGFDTRHMGHRRRHRPNPWFRKGEVSRSALDVLRTTERPLTAREIANRMLAAKGITDATLKQARLLTAAVKTSLSNHAGKTTERIGEGMPARWRLVM